MRLLRAALFSLWGERVLSCQEPFWTQILHTVSRGSCALAAASGTTCSFDIVSHSLWPQLLSSPAAVRCLWNVSDNKPSPLAAACLGSRSKGSSARFFMKSPDIYPLVLSPRSYSSSQLLLWHSFILHRARFVSPVDTADTTAIFFSSQRYRAGFCTHFLTGINGWAETQLAWQLWSFRDLITHYWNAVNVLVEFEGNSGKREVLCYRKKTTDASFADETAAASEFFLWDVLCLGYILSFGVNDFLCEQVFYLLLHMNKFCN